MSNVQTVFRKRLAFVIILLVTASACSSISTGAHYDETVDMSGYRSFSWIDRDPALPNPGSDPADSPLLNTYVTRAIKQTLETKGFDYTPDRTEADFVVAYTIGSRDRITADTYPDGYRGGYWGWHVYGPYYGVRHVQHRMYTQGTLSVDVFDAQSKTPVWHGWATKSISDKDRNAPSEPITQAIEKLLGDFPPR